MDMGRIVLHAALGKISRGENVEVAVKDSLGVLARYSHLADSTLVQMASRPGGEWLRERLEYQDLTNVGNYSCTREKSKKGLTIAFSVPAPSIEFSFSYNPVYASQRMFDKLLSLREEGASSQQEVDALLARSLIAHLTGDVLGENSRDLSMYHLDKVSVIKKVKRRFIGTKEDRQIVYPI